MRWRVRFWTSLKKFKTEAQFCAKLGFFKKIQNWGALLNLNLVEIGNENDQYFFPVMNLNLFMVRNGLTGVHYIFCSDDELYRPRAISRTMKSFFIFKLQTSCHQALYGCTYIWVSEFESFVPWEKKALQFFWARLFGRTTEKSEFCSLGPSCQQPIKFIPFSLKAVEVWWKTWLWLILQCAVILFQQYVCTSLYSGCTVLLYVLYKKCCRTDRC
jgi:hypothetical protein